MLVNEPKKTGESSAWVRGAAKTHSRFTENEPPSPPRQHANMYKNTLYSLLTTSISMAWFLPGRLFNSADSAHRGRKFK